MNIRLNTDLSNRIKRLRVTFDDRGKAYNIISDTAFLHAEPLLAAPHPSTLDALQLYEYRKFG